MRRLHPPTLAQWGCEHRWKTTTSRPGEGDVLRVRYLTCRHCQLKVKTEERMAVPWGEADLLVQVKALLPVGTPVYLRDYGITELPLDVLNAHLDPLGYAIHASLGCYAAKAVMCVGPKGQPRWHARFELRRLEPGGEGSQASSHQH